MLKHHLYRLNTVMAIKPATKPIITMTIPGIITYTSPLKD